MTDAIIQFSFAGLASPYCYTTPERFALDIAAGLQGYLPGTYSTIIKSSTEPVATDRDKVWYQINADGASTGRQFTWAYGKWVMQNPRRDPAERVWFEGSEAEAWAYDGGDGTDPSSNAPTQTTGAMWEVDHNYDFRFPLGAGTSPKPTTVSVGGTGGAEEVVLTAAQVAKHQHKVWPSDGGDGNTGMIWSHVDPGSESCTSDLEKGIQPSDDCPNQTTLLANFQTDGDEAHPNMGPYRAGFFLKPTQRQFWTP